jgi:hypothetical protein
MKIIKIMLPLTLYIALTVFEWHLYFIEKDCFDKGGRLAVVILYTTPLALAVIAILWTALESLVRICVSHLS